MITKYDEMFCHQAVSTFDRPGTSAREWTERGWIQVRDIAATAHLAAGFGYYPNRNVMDAFVCFNIQEETQYVVRASRELRPDIDVFRVGPFSYEVIEPLKKVRFALDENDYGLSYDIEIEGTSPLHEEEPAQKEDGHDVVPLRGQKDQRCESGAVGYLLDQARFPPSGQATGCPMG